jgi:hypothetical protein
MSKKFRINTFKDLQPLFKTDLALKAQFENFF